MKTFYLHENGQQSGPFSIDELKQKSISFTTPVWKEGMAAWATAGELDELSSLFRLTPPDRSSIPPMNYSPRKTETEYRNLKVKKVLGWIGLAATIIIIVSFVVYKNQQSELIEPKLKTPEQMRAEYLKNEQHNPAAFISGFYRNKNALLSQRMLHVDLNNNATLANYRDVILNVTYLNKTGAEIKTEKITVAERLDAGQTVRASLKAFAPSATRDVKIAVAAATAVD